MSLGVIVITHQSAEHIGSCLSALLEAGSAPPLRTVVWDNASTDGSVAMARDRAPLAEVTACPENLGFAAAVNRAAALMPGLDLLLLNPDAVLAPGSVSSMVGVLRDHAAVAVAGAHLIDSAGVPQPDSWSFPTPWRTTVGALVGLGRAYRVRRRCCDGFDDVGEAFVPFTAAVLRRSVFDRLGGLDENFWLYGEDAEYCYRARRLGARIAVVHRAHARHVGGASSTSQFRSLRVLEGGDRFRDLHFSRLGTACAAQALRLGAAGRVGWTVAAARLTGGDPSARGEWRDVASHYRRRVNGRPPAVLQVILSSELHGTERHVAELCRTLRSRGWRTMVAVRADIGPELRSLYGEVAELCPLPSVPSPLIIPILARRARRDRVDVIHGHLGDGSIAAIGAGRLALIPTVTTTHFVVSRHATRRGWRMRRAVYRTVLRRATAVIAVSGAVEAAVHEAHGPGGPPVHMIWNGVACLPTGAQPTAPPTRPMILYIGRLSPEKQVDALIRAVAQVGIDCDLWIAGTGPDEAALRRLAADIGGQVRFLGFVADTTELLRDASVLALPSRAEPFGLVVIEAMRAGRPVVGFAAGALPEIVVDGETGALVPAGDISALAAALRDLLTDPERAQRYGEAGRRRFAELFTSERMAERTESLYRSVLTTRP